MKKAIIVLNFDDGRKINDQILQYMIENDIPATFFINISYVNNEAEISTKSVKAMSKEDVKKLEKIKNFEIASHGYEHTNDWDSIERGVNVLRSWKNKNNIKIGFASPISGLKESEILEHQEKVKSLGISYIRLGLNIKTHYLVRILARKMARITKSKFLYRIAYNDTLMGSIKNGICYCVPVLRDTGVGQLESLVQKGIEEKKVCVILFHSIASKEDKEYGDTWSWKKEKYLKFCEYLLEQRNAGRLELMTMEQAVQELGK